MPCVVGNFLESLGPIVAAPGEHGDRRVFDVDLHPITIELDLVQPALARWHLIDRCCQRRFNEAGIIGLGAYRRRFFTLKRHNFDPDRDVSSPSALPVNGSCSVSPRWELMPRSHVPC
jgi:hypothetical protein